MIFDVSHKLLIALLVATLLGCIMGYLAARLFAGRKNSEVVRTMQAELTKERAVAEEQISQLSSEKIELNRLVKVARDKIQLANKNLESKDSQVQRLNQRIKLLEVEASESEEKHIKLQRDFAVFKSNKTRELELAQSTRGSLTKSEQLPVLSKRIGNEVDDVARTLNLKSGYRSTPGHAVNSKSVLAADELGNQLGVPWSNDLDIPTLAESELPDSVEELEIALADLEADGADVRG